MTRTPFTTRDHWLCKGCGFWMRGDEVEAEAGACAQCGSTRSMRIQLGPIPREAVSQLLSPYFTDDPVKALA
jgi:hypothetical protein